MLGGDGGCADVLISGGREGGKKKYIKKNRCAGLCTERPSGGHSTDLSTGFYSHTSVATILDSAPTWRGAAGRRAPFLYVILSIGNLLALM